MSYIRAPYNFVPLNKHIFFPEWAQQISHDIPFSDGESGIIDITVKAESPIFIRNASQDKDDNNFSYISGQGETKQYFIPGTSLKGMIRSVLEIMSYGKMQFVDNRKYTWRELSTPEYSNRFTKNFESEPLVKAGFIKIIDGEWQLFPCKYARIEQCHLDSEIGVSKIRAKEKYDYWIKTKNKKLINNFTISELGTKVFEKQCGKFRKATLEGDTLGQLVFTGQIKERLDKGEGEHGTKRKHLEFVFYNEFQDSIPINSQMRKDFVLNHSDDRNKEKHKTALSPNKEWGYWKDKLYNGERMPVFWLGTYPKIDSFGLAMLFRLPLKYSVHDLIKRVNPDHIGHTEKNFRPDLTDCIFGHSVGSKTLKGRVQFSHALCISKNPEVLELKQNVLSSPKPTFYFNYLKDGNYNDDESNISGRKRYPVRNSIEKYSYDPKKTNLDKVGTKFKPLNKGSEFNLKIRFHNLKKIEIGSLLTAITFYNNENKFYHSLGMAKPLGYGKVSLSINDIVSDNLTMKTMTEYMDCFINEMEKVIKTSWGKSQSIIELLTMATPQDNKPGTESELSYMELKEFVAIKNEKKALKYYSQIGNGISEEKIIREEDIPKLIQESNIKDLKKIYKNNSEMKTKVESLLEAENPSDVNIYKDFISNPKILLKYLKAKNLKSKELKKLLDSVKHSSYDKSNRYTQEIFNYLIESMYKDEIPDQMPERLNTFKYTWYDKSPDKDELTDILNELEKGTVSTWPPIEELKDYIHSKDWKDKEDFIELFELFSS